MSRTGRGPENEFPPFFGFVSFKRRFGPASTWPGFVGAAPVYLLMVAGAALSFREVKASRLWDGRARSSGDKTVSAARNKEPRQPAVVLLTARRATN